MKSFDRPFSKGRKVKGQRPLSNSAEVETPMTQKWDRSILQLHEDKGGILHYPRERLTESDKI